MPLFTRRKLGINSQNQTSSAPSSPLKQSFHNTLNAEGELRRRSCSQGESLLDELGEASTLVFVTPLKTKSRLSKNLNDVLHDHCAIAFFIQFMETRNAVDLVKFWLDAQSFQASAWTRQQYHSTRKHSDGTSFTGGTQRANGITPNKTRSMGFQRTDSGLGIKLCSSLPPDITSSAPDLSKTDDNDSGILRTTPFCLNSELSSKNFATNENGSHENEYYSEGSSPSFVLYDDDSVSSHFSSAPFLNYTQNKRSSSLSDILPQQEINENKDCDSTHIDTADLPIASHSVIPSTAAFTAKLSQHNRSYSADSNIVDKLQRSIAEDAVKIFTKYIAKDATNPIGVTDEMRNEITGKICQENGQVDPQCFSSAQQFIVNILEEKYFDDYLQSDFHCKYQFDVLTSGKVYLEDILYNETALSFFREFLELEGKRNLLEFLITADNFRLHLLGHNDNSYNKEAQDDAMVLYDKYFSLQATCPLGFSDAVRFEVEQNICREEGPLPDCFDKPVKIVHHVLQKNYLKPFLASQLYCTYLSELLNTACSNPFITTYRKRSGSDSSSEHSISTQNTLLAMDSTQPGVHTHRILKNIENQDLRIDTERFKPEALWKRNIAGKLSMGRMNGLGQFITEFEPEPDRKAESRLSKAVKKLVSKDEDKAKEEMAWQVAEMIVKEVTSLTCKDMTDTSKEQSS